MKRLLVFGCSLSSYGESPAWCEEVANALDLEILNFSVAGGSNMLQIKRFQEFLVNDNISQDDIVIWQLTGTLRSHRRSRARVFPWLMNKLGPASGTVISENNYFDNEPRIDFLFYHKECNNIRVDEEDLLQDLLFCIKVAKRFTGQVLVIKGWDEIFPLKYFTRFNYFLKSHNIDFLSTSIISYARENKLPFKDDCHPNDEAGKHFATHYIIPEFRRLGWI